MYVPVLNYFIDVEEIIVVFCIVIVAYLAVMHVEFKQLKLISRGFSKEDTDLSGCIRELKNDMNNLNDIVRTGELKTISSHVTGNAAQLAAQKPTPSSDESPSQDTASESKETGDSADTAKKPKKDTGASGTSSLKDMLDKV